MATLTFENIFHGLNTTLGRIRLAAVGLAWQSADKEQTVTVPVGDIKYLQWIRVARNFQLRVTLKQDRRRETFDGFQRDDHDKVASFVKQHYSLALETVEVGVKGWNWGSTDVRGGDLAFLVSNRTIFEVPLTRIANSNIVGKTEVTLEFVPQTAAPSAQGKNKGRAPAHDDMVEMRLFVPGPRARGSDEEQSDAEANDVSAAQAFHDMIKEKAEIGQVTGEGIVTFSDILVQTPRGRYDIDMFPSFLRLRGKTYDYKVLYSSVTRIFLLPKPDEIHVQLVVGLDPPIRQGQTQYPYLVLNFSREEELDIELNIDQETIDAKYEGKLQKKYDLPTYRVVSEVFRGLSGRKMIAPGSFASRDNQHGIKANMKAVTGELYFLEKSLIFVAKQPTVVDYADIHQIVFSRLGSGMASARTFDIRVVTKAGPVSEVAFTSINKEEFEPVEDFLKAKKIRTKNEINEDAVLAATVLEDDDSDEDMASGNADFHASESDEGEPTDDDSDTSGASDVSDASGDIDIVKSAQPKKKKKKAAAEGDDAEAPPKKKKKAAAEGDDPDAPPKKKKKAAKKEDEDEEMADANEEKPKAKPKPKKVKKEEAADPDAPPKKKAKKSSPS
ncbi:FACT complex subunit [Tulasnella sp. 424]|nr:FACT complex subunit [Tulasnella sp. 424]KAG8963852.1 FACT complex subunit [Tulasnella sp. 425]